MIAQSRLTIGRWSDGLAGISARAFGAGLVQAVALCFALCAVSGSSHAQSPSRTRIQQAVDAAIRPMMAKNKIPGAAVGIIVDGPTKSRTTRS